MMYTRSWSGYWVPYGPYRWPSAALLLKVSDGIHGSRRALEDGNLFMRLKRVAIGSGPGLLGLIIATDCPGYFSHGVLIK
uniref:Uncharacterized protein n=1 Tax=Nelumbo nucifera TaxID=4432 RepID=A0A822YJE6_NELNU|nr:TPA_asm: hypothetical protein HUJ06_009907 [Nelumbo nucifera]